MFRKNLIIAIGMTAVLLALSSTPIFGRASLEYMNSKGFGASQALAPAHGVAAHRIGNIALAVMNNGTFGRGFSNAPMVDCFTQIGIPRGCEVPRNGGVDYLFAASFWIGAIVGRDTLVSTGADGWLGVQEMLPPDWDGPDACNTPDGIGMQKRSIIDPSNAALFEGAVSEEDYIAVYNDTTTEGVLADPEDSRQHIPLHIEVTQRSFAWSYEYAEDLVLFDYEIKNIGVNRIRGAYMGVYVDADISSDANAGFDDDLCGFVATFLDTHLICEFEDVANIAWIADNDGDPFDPSRQPCPHVTATRIVRTPAESLEVSFNWWISNGDAPLDFGPRERPGVGRWKEPFRDFGTGGLGTPSCDDNKYYIMRNQEFDYDQAYVAKIRETDTLWLEPPTTARIFARGFDTRYLLSFGPFDIDPGEALPISFSYLAGFDFHSDPDNLDNLPDDPDTYYKNLDFGDLNRNARWASWIYDNPGVDTDSDGYAGEMRLCTLEVKEDSFVVIDDDTTYFYTATNVDTTYATGDGVPDFRGASPPPAPAVFLEPTIGSIHVRFNGYRSETTTDPFSRLIDFEGYRIYISRDDLTSGYSRVVSFDRVNFNKWVWDTRVFPAAFMLREAPFTLEELIDLYAFGNANWNPLDYNSSSQSFDHPLFPDSTFYFVPQDFNVGDLDDPYGIRKVYGSDVPYPSSLVLDSLDESEKTPEGLPKYFEYEYTITDLLPTVPYWVSVTAFDFGSPQSGLPSLETAVSFNSHMTYPLESGATVAAEDLKPYVYPNPYRVDAGYRDAGYEAIDSTGAHHITGSQDYTRRVHFANLPPVCTIRIYSLDGDLIREIDHDRPIGDPLAAHETWDLITRNTQQVVSGLYYWTIEDGETGKIDIGKLVIIM